MGMAYNRDAVVAEGKLIRRLFHIELVVGIPGGGDVPNPQRFQKVSQAETDDIIEIRVQAGRLMAVVNVDRYETVLNTHGIVH